MRKFLCAILLLIPVTLFGQTSSTVLWNQPETNASTFTYTLKIDTAAPLTLVATCNAGNCSAPFPTPATGPHTYTLTATNSFGSASTTIGPGEPPKTSGFKVTITIVITP